jgi:hypothetical protein
MPFEVLLT